MLDSTAVVAAEREAKNARQLLEQHRYFSAVLELVHSAAKGGSDSSTSYWSACRSSRSRHRSLYAPVRQMAAAEPVVSRGSAECVSALELRYAVGTGNIRHFQLIPELDIPDYR